MIRKIAICLLFAATLLSATSIQDGPELCGTTNTTFKSGESISMNIYYTIIGIYVHAGTANFTTTEETLNGRTVYHAVGTGWTNSKYDWIFKVRDRYESYFDTGTMLPVKFIRNVQEGKYIRHQTVTFDHRNKKAITEKGSFSIPGCTQDIISAVFNVRNINFDNYKAGDKIPFDMFLDDELYHMYIRYLGKENVKTRFGTYKAIRFRPLLLKGNAFKGGENMNVWVSDDGNHIPLRIESSLSVGSIKVDMTNAVNLRHPFTSKLAK